MTREEAIALFEKQLTAAQVVLDSGFGSNPGENNSLCVDTGEIFDSTKEAERVTGAYHSHISRCCNGKEKTAGGLSWRYA